MSGDPNLTMSPTDIMPLIAFYASVRKHTAESFAKKHPSPLLLYTPTLELSAPNRHFVTTQVSSINEMRRTQGTEAGKRGVEQRVILVRKSTRNPFAGQIYLGRAQNNDLVIEEASVSKSHAFFELGANKVWTVSDMGSANGTFIDGKQLAANAAGELRDSGKVTFGQCEMQFFTPEKFHQFVAALLALVPASPPA